MENPKADINEKLPKLGYWLTWVDKPGSAKKILIGLALICSNNFRWIIF